MSKILPQDAAISASPADATALTLTEFCRRLSETVRRPELISAFEYSERRSGNLKGDPGAFQARFDVFVKSPV